MAITGNCSKNHMVCEGALSAMTQGEVEAQLASLDSWQLREHQLHRMFRCRDFSESVRLVTQIARISEGINHHPDFCVKDKRQVSVGIWTRRMNRLTALDFELATSINAAYRQLSTELTS